MEMGWTTDSRPNSPYAWHSVTPEQQADYLVKAMQYARANWSQWAGPMVVLYIPEPEWTANDEQYYWSITNPDGTVRPAYTALKAFLLQNRPPSAAGAQHPARRCQGFAVACGQALTVSSRRLRRQPTRACPPRMPGAGLLVLQTLSLLTRSGGRYDSQDMVTS